VTPVLFILDHLLAITLATAMTLSSVSTGSRQFPWRSSSPTLQLRPMLLHGSML